jgi:hypothetical protein
MHMARYRLAFLALIALTGCALLPRPADSQVVSLLSSISIDADKFFTGLATKQSPDCAFPANTSAYDHLTALADALKQRLSSNSASPALVQASDALLRTIGDARASHLAASATTDDAGGACMVPGAITLNADAVARARAAIAATQKTIGAQ